MEGKNSKNRINSILRYRCDEDIDSDRKERNQSRSMKSSNCQSFEYFPKTFTTIREREREKKTLLKPKYIFRNRKKNKN